MRRRRIRVAVVGAGISGLAAARALRADGHEVVVLEKARGAGGRLSTRRADGVLFDHGAPYFTARGPRLRRQVREWRSRGVVQDWGGCIGAMGDGGGVSRVQDEHLVGVPGMSALCRDLAAGLPEVRYGCALEAAAWDGSRWLLGTAGGGDLHADALVMTVPPAQSRALLMPSGCGMEIPLVRMRPCWAVMAVFDRPLLNEWDGLSITAGPLGWVASQRSRPGRPDAHAWVLHASAAWSGSHLEADRGDVSAALLDAARRLPGAQPVAVASLRAHRWRYAQAGQPSRQGPLSAPKYKLVVTGDWRQGGGVEGAFLGGLAAADTLSSWRNSS